LFSRIPSGISDIGDNNIGDIVFWITISLYSSNVMLIAPYYAAMQTREPNLVGASFSEELFAAQVTEVINNCIG